MEKVKQKESPLKYLKWTKTINMQTRWQNVWFHKKTKRSSLPSKIQPDPQNLSDEDNIGHSFIDDIKINETLADEKLLLFY